MSQAEVHIIRVLRIAAVILGLGLMGSLLPPAQAGHIGCGAVLGPGGSFALDSDVGPCDDPGPAITVNSAILHLRGFMVSCADTNSNNILPDGIRLTGENSLVTSGEVTGCESGVVVAGIGRHTVRNVISDGNGDNGFLVTFGSRNNSLKGSTARNNGDDGFDIRGDKNKLTNNTSEFNGDDGFDVRGNLNRLNVNTATNNSDDGFLIRSDDNRLAGNTAANNTGDGLDVSGDGNSLLTNVATGNNGSGILIRLGATSNFLVQNTATGNGLDLADDNPGCDDNIWAKNTFGTKSQDCIQ